MSEEVKEPQNEVVEEQKDVSFEEVDFMGQKVYVKKGVSLDSLITEKVEEEVKKRITGNTPKRNTTDVLAQKQREFNKMGYKERLKLYQEDPTLYEQLANR